MAEYQSMLRKCCGWIVFVLLFGAVFGGFTPALFCGLVGGAVGVVALWAGLALLARVVEK